MINNILGAGQIAQALYANINGDIKTFDKGQWENEEAIKTDILHICIPYSNNFIDIVRKAKYIFQPEVVIIHSTVKPGTSKEIGCLYSPVVGRHNDDFKNNIQSYRKFIAGDWHSYEKTDGIFKNIEPEYWGSNTDELEYAKIMSTTRMYWDLIFQKAMQEDCNNNDYDFTQVYNRWTDNYNAGIAIKHPNWQRPIYEKMETPYPGGHCLRPNIHLFNNGLTEFIKLYENKKDILYIVTREQEDEN